MTVDVERLTREHRAVVRTDEGIEFHLVPSLLSQLHDAIFGGMESTGGGSAMGARLPIAANALDLNLTIDRQITEAWVHAFSRVPGAGTPESLLAEWAAWAEPDTIVEISAGPAYAADLVTYWERRITDFFDPPRSAEIDASCPMPECGLRYVYRNVSGEEIRSAALQFTRNRSSGQTTDARCLACGTVWQPAEFERLAAVIGIDVESKKRAHQEEEVDQG